MHFVIFFSPLYFVLCIHITYVWLKLSVALMPFLGLVRPLDSVYVLKIYLFIFHFGVNTILYIINLSQLISHNLCSSEMTTWLVTHYESVRICYLVDN